MTPSQIEKLKELTASNEHQLALWYATHQLGFKSLEHEAATNVCLYMLEGQLTSPLKIYSNRIRAKLIRNMSKEDRADFISAT